MWSKSQTKCGVKVSLGNYHFTDYADNIKDDLVVFDEVSFDEMHVPDTDICFALIFMFFMQHVAWVSRSFLIPSRPFIKDGQKPECQQKKKNLTSFKQRLALSYPND